MRGSKTLGGRIQFRIVTADWPRLQASLLENGVILRNVFFTDDLTVCFTVSREDQEKVRILTDKRGEKCVPVRKTGLYWAFRSLKNRFVLLFGLVALLFLTFWVPSRVLFVFLNGNAQVPETLILEKAADCGLAFGASRKDIRSENIKNQLLEAIPDLEWVGVTTSGCVATVEVREKDKQSASSNTEPRVSSIVAATDGVIESVTTLNGTQICKVGQAVYAGQTLISGYEDRGRVAVAGRAEGEVYAYTVRHIRMCTPSKAVVRTAEKHSSVKYILQIGKKQIFFSKDSGICPPTCVRIYEKINLTLPGGFSLPITWIKVQQTAYETQEANAICDTGSWLEKCAVDHIKSQMIAGQILNQELSYSAEIGVNVLYGQFFCREQIGKLKAEETLEHDGENS